MARSFDGHDGSLRLAARRLQRSADAKFSFSPHSDVADHLVAQFSAIDGDPDREPDPDDEDGRDDEPSLGAPAGGDSQGPWAARGGQKLERGETA